MENIVAQMAGFSVALVRISGMIVAAPIIAQSLPVRYKGAISFLLTIIIYPVVRKYIPAVSIDKPVFYAIVLLDEFMIGALIGVVMNIIFSSAQLAGQYYSLQMGISIMQVFNPMSGDSAAIVGQLKQIFATLIFFLIDGHHALITAATASFINIPSVPIAMSKPIAVLINNASRYMFYAAFQLAIPIMGTIFLVEVAIGILAKVAPQMNILLVGLPLKILIGFFTLMVMTTVLFEMLGDILGRGFGMLYSFVGL